MGNSMKLRQFTVCQFEKNPRTNEYIVDLNDIIKRLGSYTSFTEWACCIHDKDVYTDDAIDDMRYTLIKEAKKQGITDEVAVSEYISSNSWAKVGDIKGKHIHVVVKCANSLKIEHIANWLGVPEHLVKKVKGRGAFLDCLEYLTHENEKQQELGKYRYDDSEVITSASASDWRERLNLRKVDEDKYGVGKNLKQKYIIDVAEYGMTLNQCYKKLDGDEYISMLCKLQKARQEYLTRKAILPNTRINVYVFGSGGTGKDVFCELLSQALYPELDDIRDVMFGIGDGNSTFDGYDGQPVLVWSDFRASHFQNLGKRLTLTALEPHPKFQGGNVDIKFGSTKLINSYNIINGVENFHVFIQRLTDAFVTRDGLHSASEVNNIEQFYRRIPVVVCLAPDRFTITVNSGVYFGNNNFQSYELYKQIKGSFAYLQKVCGSDKEFLKKLSSTMISPVVEIIREIHKKLDTPEKSRDDIIRDLDKLGFGDVLSVGQKFEEPVDLTEWQTILE